MFDLAGRRALVTGASGAIGGAISRMLGARGAELCLAGRNRDALDAVAADIGDAAHVIVADLSEPDSAAHLVDGARSAMGGVDVLVNNAGFARDNLGIRMKDEEWQQVLEVNLTAAFRLSRAVLRDMLRARWGRIISVTSVVGVAGNPGQANYAASKAGIAGMSKALAAEVAARGITVNCVAPGFIDTAMTEAIRGEHRETLVAGIPVGRLGSPEDVGACAVFLASEEAAYVTGQTLHVNGGMIMV